MKHRFHLLFLLALTIGIARLPAQSTDVSTPSPGSTVITSDELRADQENHTAIFTGNVVVTGTNFTMRCQEMTVTYTKDNKIDNILAKGDVVIQQPDRITHSGQAQYFHEDDKFVLTDQPSIIDNKNNKIVAPKITIYRTTQQLVTEGSTTTTLQEGVGPAGTPPPSAGK